MSANDLNAVENFVRTELVQMLTNKSCENIIFDEKEKIYFFGVHEFNPAKFKFLSGDKNLILGLVQQLKKKLEKTKNENNMFEMPTDYKMSRKDTKLLSVGVFFARKLTQPLPAISSNKQQEIICEKLNDIINSWPNGDFKTTRHFKDDDIEIINTGNRIRADVTCVFCAEQKMKKKKIVVQSETRQNQSTLYWNFGNLKKHLKVHIIPSSKKEDRKSEMSDVEHVQSSRNSIESNRSSSEPVDQTLNSAQNGNTIAQTLIKDLSIEANEYRNIMLQQILANNLAQTEKRLKYSEVTEEMKFEIHKNDKKTLRIVKINPDGSCLFGSIAQQIFDVKINSVQHGLATNELRTNVVKYIKDHMDNFVNELTGRVLDIKRKDEIKDMSVERESIVNKCLPRRTFWGGEESTKAISIIYGVNIIIFNEGGTCYFAADFKKEHNRCAIIAYRKEISSHKLSAGKLDARKLISRNHYDSIFELSEEYLQECVDVLVKSKIDRDSFENEARNGQVCYTIDDTKLDFSNSNDSNHSNDLESNTSAESDISYIKN